jgi:hypothetical protein
MPGNAIGTYLKIAALTTAGLAVFPLVGVADDAVHRAELRRLFDPQPAQLRTEERGQVHIYDGLSDRDVKRAMDQQFDRVDHMMFVHTVVTGENEQGQAAKNSTGNGFFEDDGCD